MYKDIENLKYLEIWYRKATRNYPNRLQIGTYSKKIVIIYLPPYIIHFKLGHMSLIVLV